MSSSIETETNIGDLIKVFSKHLYWMFDPEKLQAVRLAMEALREAEQEYHAAESRLVADRMHVMSLLNQMIDDAMDKDPHHD